jgi:hypothetical protein
MHRRETVCVFDDQRSPFSSIVRGTRSGISGHVAHSLLADAPAVPANVGVEGKPDIKAKPRNVA